MSRHTKIETDHSVDPDLWKLYEEIWQACNEAYHRHSLYGSDVANVANAKLEIMEKVVTMNRNKVYRRTGEPIRVTMIDVIAYHEMLDRKYLSQEIQA